MTEIFKSFDINYYSKPIFLKNSKDENVKIEKENDLYNLKWDKDLILRKNAYIEILKFVDAKNEALAPVFIENLKKNSAKSRESGYQSLAQACLMEKLVDLTTIDKMCKIARQNIDIKREFDSIREYLLGKSVDPWFERVHELVGKRDTIKMFYLLLSWLVECKKCR